MDNLDQHIKIHHFLAGKLSKEAKEEFEKEIEADISLKKKIELNKQANSLLLENKLVQVKALALEVHQTDLRRLNRINTTLIIVGILSLSLIGLSVYYFTQKETEKSTLTSKDQIVYKESNAQVEKEMQPQVLIKKQKFEIPNSKIELKDTFKLHPSTTKEAFSVIEVKKTIEENPNKLLSSTKQEKPTGDNVETKTDFCLHRNIRFNTTVTPTCAGQNEGFISVSSIIGGKSPYRYALVDQEGNKTEILNGLSSGIYTFTIEDADKCTKSESIKITEKACPVHHVIQLSANKYLTIDENESAAKFIVTDKANQIYFSSNILSNTKYTWEGQNNQGITKEGVYLYSIEYKDKIITGTITIVD